MSLRKEIENDIFEMLDDADPSGANTERMREFFRPMSDQQFYRYMDQFYNDPDQNYMVSYKPYENPVTVEFIEKIMDKHGIPLYEYVYKPFLTGDAEDPPRTTHKQMVVDIPVKRLKQMVQIKNHVAVNPNKVDPRSGQMSGHDRVARVTQPELFSMLAQNQYNAAKEYFGPMADDTKSQRDMERRIMRDGEVSLADLKSEPSDIVSLNTIAYYMYGGGIRTNLVDPTGYIMPITQKEREGKSSTIDRGEM